MKHPSQIVGNIGLYYACYKLSMMGWNVMPTSRNARGIDVICFSMDGSRMLSFQIKTLSRRNPVPLGTSLDNIMADFWIIVTGAASDTPKCYILLPHEVRALAFRGEIEGRVSYWLQPRAYAVKDFEERWTRIGYGVPPEVPPPKLPPKVEVPKVDVVMVPISVPSFSEHTATALVRWMGKEAWSFAEARKAADALGLDIMDSTLQTQLSAGRREVDKIPGLTKEQSDYLNALRPKA